MKLRLSLAYLALSVGLTALVYMCVQQSLRLTANDPQIQLAEDASRAIQNGAAPASVVSGLPVDASASLAPFVTVYDAGGRPVATSGTFTGQTLAPPAGTFEYAKAHAQDHFTWVPSAGGRYAAVLVYNGPGQPGYVLAARSLFEVEQREYRVEQICGAALAALLLIGLALLVFPRK